MGGAAAAYSSGPNAIYYNPAGLSRRGGGITGEYTKLLPDVSYSWLGSAFSSGGQSFGLGIVSLDLGEITRRDSLMDTGSPTKSYQRAYLFGISPGAGGRVRLGTTLGLLDFRLADYESKAYFADFGLTGATGDHLTLGAVLKNAYFSGLNFAGNKEVYPQELRLGAALHQGPLALMSQVEKVLDGSKPRFAVGLGYAPVRIFTLRLGLNGNPRFGFGLAIKNNLFALDFSWQMRAISPTARVGLSYFFKEEDVALSGPEDPVAGLKSRAKTLKSYLEEESKRFLQEGELYGSRKNLEKLYVLDPENRDTRASLFSLAEKEKHAMRFSSFSLNQPRDYPRIRLSPLVISREEKMRRRLWLRFAVAYAEDQIAEYASLAQEFCERWPRDSRSTLIRHLLPTMVRPLKEGSDNPNQ